MQHEWKLEECTAYGTWHMDFERPPGQNFDVSFMIWDFEMLFWGLTSMMPFKLSLILKHGQDIVISLPRSMTCALVLARLYLNMNQLLQISLQEIALSVTQPGRFHSYLALGGPAWLHNRIQEEAISNIC